MTDEELKELVAENTRAIRELRTAQAENNEQWRILREESERQRQESERQRQESERQWQEYREESKRQRQESKRQRQESERQRQDSERQRQDSERQRQDSEKRWQDSEKRWQESEKRWQESGKRWQESGEKSERLWREILASREETDRLITSFNRELGRLGNKIGDYTESLLRPSLRRVMREQFEMTSIISPLSMERHGETLQIDLVAYGESATDAVYVVEMKSTLRPDAFDQLFEHMRKLPRFCPEHRGKKLFGVLAALDIPENLRTRALKEGVYLGTIKADVFEIVPPDDFVPRAFGLRGLG